MQKWQQDDEERHQDDGQPALARRSIRVGVAVGIRAAVIRLWRWLRDAADDVPQPITDGDGILSAAAIQALYA